MSVILVTLYRLFKVVMVMFWVRFVVVGVLFPLFGNVKDLS